MYENFFGLSREPFSVAPDPRFIYLSPKHREAVSHLMYGLRRGAGFLLMTGEIGAGKTTVWRAFLSHIPQNVDVAFVVNPKLDAPALLRRICEDLRVDVPAGTTDLIDAIHGHLLLSSAQGRKMLIVVDEAQVLAADVLEQMRLLTNLDNTGGKLQVLLIGQPELRTMLAEPALAPVEQRVVARFHLPALPPAETARYITHRLSVAGLVGDMPFDTSTMQLIHDLCAGVPRRINVLCDRALALAQLADSRRITDAIVTQAAIDVFGDRSTAAEPPRAPGPSVSSAAITTRAPDGVVEPAAEVSPDRRQQYVAAAGAGLVAVGLLLGYGLAHKPTPDPAGLQTTRSVPAATEPTGTTRSRPEPETPLNTPVLADVRAALTDGGPSPPPTAAAASDTDVAASPAKPVVVYPSSTMDSVLATAARDEAYAWRQLARLWNTPLGAGEPCTAALLSDLYCYRSTGGLGAIRQLGRPGLLMLNDDAGHVAYAVLIGLGPTTATFAADGNHKSVPLSDLARHWRGEYATLWHSPPAYRPNEMIGASDRLAPWLAERLAVVDGKPSAPLAGEALTARIFAFQVAQGLKPDGVAGPLTLMQLNRASGVREPQLATTE